MSIGLAGGAIVSRGTAEQLERWALPIARMDKIAAWCLTDLGATAVRSLSHRGPHLDQRVAARIRTGAAMAILTIGLTIVSDLAALVLMPLPDPLARTDGRLALIGGLLLASITTTLVATLLLTRARARANAAADLAAPVGGESDIIDDLLELAREGARLVPPVRSIANRLTAVVERFLVGSPVSPRRHRLGFGVVAAVAAGVAYDAWHAIVEGPWGSTFALGLFTVLVSGGVLAVYLATVGPLRLVRPAEPA